MSLRTAIDTSTCTPEALNDKNSECWKNLTDPVTDVGSVPKAVENAVESWTDSAVGQFAKAMMEGYDYVLKEFMTSWLGKGILVDMDGPSVSWFQQSMGLVSVFLVTLGLMFAGIRVMLDRNGKPLKEVVENLGKVLFVTFAGTSLVQVFVIGADAFNKWILDAAGLSANVEATAAAVGAPGVAILLGLFAIITVLIQWVLMFVRGALLPLLVAWWPVAAAASMLKGGDSTFKGVTRWILAFLIYSPVAACIYALAWRMKNGQEGIGGVINGWVLIALAVLALPALLRLLTPAVEAVGRMAAGTMALGVAAGTIVAAGAVGAAVYSGGASAAAGGAAAKAPASAGGPAGAAPGGGGPGGGGPGGGPGGGGGSPLGDGPSGASSVAQGGGSSSQGSASGAQGALGDGGQSSSADGAQPSSLVPSASSGTGTGGSTPGSASGGAHAAPGGSSGSLASGGSGAGSTGGDGAPAGGASASAPTASQVDQVSEGGSGASTGGTTVASGASPSAPPTATPAQGANAERRNRVAQAASQTASTLAQGAATTAAKAEETMTE